MKTLALTAMLATAALTSACTTTDKHTANQEHQKPVQHLKVAEVTSMHEAQKIFVDKTAEIRSKTQLDPVQLQEIHIITYTLEKSVAYLAENLVGDEQKIAQELTVVVEDIHVDAENNLKDKTAARLKDYFGLADQLIASF